MSGTQTAANVPSSKMSAGVEIRRALVPAPNGITSTQAFDLIEIAASTVPDTVIAIVLDLSDSCGPMPALLARLPTLLSKLPMKWPVWIYCLSKPSEVFFAESMNVRHLVEGSLDISSIINDRQRRQTAAGCGSFAGPVIESINERRAIESLEEAVVILLTDGRLTDFSPVNVLSGLRLAGLTDNADRSSDAIWRSVFPCHRLFRLSEPDFDSWLDGICNHSPRKFHVDWEGDGRALVRILGKDGSLKPAEHFEWNSAMMPCQFLLPSATADTFDVILNSDSPAPHFRLSIANARKKPSDEAMAAASAAFLPTSTARDIIIDTVAGETGFGTLWTAAAELAACCNQGRRWKDGVSVISPILDRLRLFPQYQAALCICRDDPMLPFHQSSRLLVMGVRQSAGTGWEAGQSTAFGVVAETWRLRYDPMEGRWIHSHGNSEEAEVRPEGGQVLGPLRLADGSTNVFFSGTL